MEETTFRATDSLVATLALELEPLVRPPCRFSKIWPPNKPRATNPAPVTPNITLSIITSLITFFIFIGRFVIKNGEAESITGQLNQSQGASTTFTITVNDKEVVFPKHTKV